MLARAYLDQLNRTGGITAERDEAVNEVLRSADRVGSGGRAAAVVADLEAVATELDADVEEAVWLNERRLRSLADTLRGLATTLH